jgi:hypothetical protein
MKNLENFEVEELEQRLEFCGWGELPKDPGGQPGMMDDLDPDGCYY